MCHPWLAAGLTCLGVFFVARESAAFTRRRPTPDDVLRHGLLGSALRQWFRLWIAPLVDVAGSVGISADAVTVSQLVLSVVCGWAYGSGWMFIAGALVLLCGTLDVVDGELARRRGQAGPRGAFMDSVVDRYSEGAVFIGLAAYYRDAWVLWGVLAAWFGSLIVSYTRARAESLGVECRDGLLQRPERYIILGLGSIVSAAFAHLSCTFPSPHYVLAFSVLVVAILSNVTALQRMRGVLDHLP